MLINKDKEIIGETNYVYTPITKTSVDDFTLPDFVKIEFIHRELFDALLGKFEIKTDTARNLQEKIKDITSIRSYEPAQVLQKIITTTNSKVKEDQNRATEYISKMVTALYKHYRSRPNTKIPQDTKIQLLAKDNSVNDAKDLYLSSAYPSGEITEALFGRVFGQNQFLAAPHVYDLYHPSFSSEDKGKIEEYFLWLGVNQYTKFSQKSNDSDYVEYVFKSVGKPVQYRSCELEVTAIDDESFRNIVKQLKEDNKEELVFWIIHDSKIKRLVTNDEENGDIFKYDLKNEHGNPRHTIDEKPSYINYQFNKEEIFNDYLVNDNGIGFINPFEFDYKHPLFTKHHIEKRDIDNVLLKLGAKEHFKDLSFSRVESIIKKMKDDDTREHIHKIYELALDHYKENSQKLGENIHLFAKKGDDKGYFDNKEIYFTENIQLPKKDSSRYRFIRFPKKIWWKTSN